jgi:hypothetical protein
MDQLALAPVSFAGGAIASRKLLGDGSEIEVVLLVSVALLITGNVLL